MLSVRQQAENFISFVDSGEGEYDALAHQFSDLCAKIDSEGDAALVSRTKDKIDEFITILNIRNKDKISSIHFEGYYLLKTNISTIEVPTDPNTPSSSRYSVSDLDTPTPTDSDSDGLLDSKEENTPPPFILGWAAPLNAPKRNLSNGSVASTTSTDSSSSNSPRIGTPNSESSDNELSFNAAATKRLEQIIAALVKIRDQGFFVGNEELNSLVIGHLISTGLMKEFYQKHYASLTVNHKKICHELVSKHLKDQPEELAALLEIAESRASFKQKWQSLSIIWKFMVGLGVTLGVTLTILAAVLFPPSLVTTLPLLGNTAIPSLLTLLGMVLTLSAIPFVQFTKLTIYEPVLRAITPKVLIVPPNASSPNQTYSEWSRETQGNIVINGEDLSDIIKREFPEGLGGKGNNPELGNKNLRALWQKYFVQGMGIKADSADEKMLLDYFASFLNINRILSRLSAGYTTNIVGAQYMVNVEFTAAQTNFTIANGRLVIQEELKLSKLRSQDAPEDDTQALLPEAGEAFLIHASLKQTIWLDQRNGQTVLNHTVEDHRADYKNPAVNGLLKNALTKAKLDKAADDEVCFENTTSGAGVGGICAILNISPNTAKGVPSVQTPAPSSIVTLPIVPQHQPVQEGTLQLNPATSSCTR